MQTDGSSLKRKKQAKTAAEVESALSAEMESSQQLAHDLNTIADRQPAPEAIAATLKEERALRGLPVEKEEEEQQMAVDEKADSTAGRKRPREETETPALEGEQGATEEAAAQEVTSPNRKRTKKRKAAAEGAPEAHGEQTHPVMAAFRQEIQSKSMDSVHARIPAKIVELHALTLKLHTEAVPLAETVATGVRPDSGASYFPTNARTRELIELVKKQIVELTDHVGAVRMWLQFNIPPPGGQDFAAKIKEEIANELEQVNATGQSVIETLKNYSITRGLLLAQIIKHPDVADYQKGLPYMDFQHEMTLLRWLKDLRNMYLSLHNTLMQNVAELSNASSDSSTDKPTRRRRGLSDSLSPPTSRRQSHQGRGSTSRRSSSSRHSSLRSSRE